MDGSEVCYHHGAMTPKGIASPHFKSGEWSDALPKRMRDRAARAFRDPDLLSLRKSIAILDARYWDVVAQSEQGETSDLWRRLHDARQAYLNATGKDAEATQRRALATVWDLIISGYNEREAWRELREIKQELRMLCESEQKSIVNKQMSMSVQEASANMGAVAYAMKDAVALITNPEERKAVLDSVSRALARLANAPDK